MPRLLLCALILVPLTGGLAPVHASPALTVQAGREGDSITLANDDISATWSVRGGSLRWQSLVNHFTEATLPLGGSVFELVPREGSVLRSADLKIVAAPVIAGSNFTRFVQSLRSLAGPASAHRT